MTRWMVLALAAALTACGADGEPETPGMSPNASPPAPPGISISGSATIGVVKRF
jgi:hypothetical protein